MNMDIDQFNVPQEEDDSLLLYGGALGFFMFMLDEEDYFMILQNQRRHRFWTRTWFKSRDDKQQTNTLFKLQQELLELGDVDEFRATLRMPPDIYEELLERVRPRITYQNTNFRQAISAEERLSITMRYLALGDGYRSLRQQYRIGLITVGKIIRDTCDALYEVLQPDFLVTPSTEEEWLTMAEEFKNRWNFPHCLGALDGKHIRLTSPPSSGSYFYNYKGFYSIILMALVNAKYEFIFVDVGAEGKASDGGVWKKTSLFDYANDATNPLNIPDASHIVGIRDPIPYFFVADDAFGLSYNLLKPYSMQGISARNRIYNYRLSRSRMVVENAFGILSTRFRIFHKEISMRPNGVEKIVLASVVLHNYLRQKCGASYMPVKSVDHDDDDHNVVKGLWRNEPPLSSIAGTQIKNYTKYAGSVRNRLADYFIQKEGEVEWQYESALI